MCDAGSAGRMTDLGITAILRGFEGNVPLAMHAKYPHANITKSGLLDALDPLFTQVRTAHPDLHHTRCLWYVLNAFTQVPPDVSLYLHDLPDLSTQLSDLNVLSWHPLVCIYSFLP